MHTTERNSHWEKEHHWYTGLQNQKHFKAEISKNISAKDVKKSTQSITESFIHWNLKFGVPKNHSPKCVTCLTLHVQKIKIRYDIQLTDNTVKQILGCSFLKNQKYFYIVEFAMQNIKLAFKLCIWLRIATWKCRIPQ